MTDASEALRLFFGLVDRQAGGRGDVDVWEGRSPVRKTTQDGGEVHRFMRLPSTGGAFVLASTDNARDFSVGLEGLTLSRPVWRLARRVLSALSPLGLHRCLGLPEFAVGLSAKAQRSYSVQAGVPGGGQKLIVREWGGEGPELFWKLGPTGLPAKLVAAEAEALRWLEQHAGSLRLAPALVDCGEAEGASWIKMEAMAGERPSNGLGQVAEDFMRRLFSVRPVRAHLEETAWFARLMGRLDAIEAGAAELTQVCRDSLNRVQGSLSAPLLFGPSHGDLTPWNARLDGGVLRAFDWEFFELEAPALFDRFHWILQTGVLVERASMETVLDNLEAPTSLSFSLDQSEFDALLTLYLVEVLSREEEIMQHERPEFVQVEWLRSTRLGILGRRAA